MRDRLTLRELEGTPSLGPTVFLAFNNARVACQEATTFKSAAQVRLGVSQRLREPVANRAGLAGQTTTGNSARDVVLPIAVGRDQWLLNEHAQHRARKEDFHGFRVDENLA